MKLNEIIDKVTQGAYIAVQTEDGGVIGGLVSNKFHITGEGHDEDFYMINVIANGNCITLDTRNDYDMMCLTTEDNATNLILKEAFDEYCMDINTPVMDNLNEVLQLWDDYDDKGKNDMSYIIWKSLDRECVKNILNRLYNDNLQLMEFADKLINKNEEKVDLLEKKAEFCKRYEELKNYIPENAQNIYDTILYDTLGLQWLKEVE